MNATHEIFLSIVLVIDDQRNRLEYFLAVAGDIARECVTDYEIIVVDNASTDGSIELLHALCGERGIPNLQVYRLAKKVEIDIAAWAGVENALGDYVAVINPVNDDLQALPSLLSATMEGADVVFGVSNKPPHTTTLYRTFSGVFGAALKRLLGIDVSKDMPFFRVLSRKVVNFMLQHQASGLTYRWLPAASGFRKAHVSYNPSHQIRRPNLVGDIDRGVRMLVSSTFGPMRLVTLLGLFGAFINVIYSVYVVAIALLKEEVAPGWVTLSLQQSGMFFLFSIILLVLGEYIIHMAKLAANAPSYYITDEFTSALITRRKRLNVEVRETMQPTFTADESDILNEDG